mgnify:CR=1 FL=1
MVVRATPDRSTMSHNIPHTICTARLACTPVFDGGMVRVRLGLHNTPRGERAECCESRSRLGTSGCRGCRGCRGILEPRVCTLVNIQTNRLPIIPFAPLRAPSRHEERHGGTETRRHGDTTTSRLGVSCQAHLILSWPDRSNAAGGPCWYATTFGHHWFGSHS